MVENPQYILEQKKIRAIVPRIVEFIFLGTLFYVGVFANLQLLSFEESTNDLIQLISLILLLILAAMGIGINVRRSSQKYLFYANRLEFGPKGIFLKDVANIQYKENIWDRTFHTYSIELTPYFVLRYLPIEKNVTNYLNQLIACNRRSG